MENKSKSFVNFANLVILSALSALVIYPLGLLFFIPISIYRVLINFLVKKWDPKVCQMITGLSAVMVGKDPYSRPEFVIMVAFPLKSKVDRNQVIDVINKQILSSDQFSQLSQRIVRKFGYNFWYKTNRPMSAEDYVHYLNPKSPDEPVTRSQVLELEAQKIARQPLSAHRSPWEIILVPNFFDDVDPSNKSMAILKTHHCLMDGYTVRNFLMKAAVVPWKQHTFSQSTKDKTNLKKWKLLQQFVILLATGPYQVIKQALFTNDNSDFMKMVFSNQQKKKEQQFLKSKDPRPRISLNRLKIVKKLHNVNVTSILITLVMGATAQFIKKRWGESKKTMFLQMPYPIPGHPGKPTNHWTSIRMPIHFQQNDFVKMLKQNTEEFDKIRNSVVPILNFYLAELLGQLPVILIPKTEDISRQVVVLSNIPGPVDKQDIFGYIYDDILVHTVMRNGTAFVFGCVSTGGQLGINFGGNSELFVTDEDFAEIDENLENILRTLEASKK